MTSSCNDQRTMYNVVHSEYSICEDLLSAYLYIVYKRLCIYDPPSSQAHHPYLKLSDKLYIYEKKKKVDMYIYIYTYLYLLN